MLPHFFVAVKTLKIKPNIISILNKCLINFYLKLKVTLKEEILLNNMVSW